MTSEIRIPLMPKATAVWLVDNTALSFKQIADFCGMHELEVKGIADGDVAQGMIGENPVINGQLKMEEIKAAEQDLKIKLILAEDIVQLSAKNKVKSKARYTPVARRQDKPDAIYWLIKTCPEISDANIKKIVGTTKSTIEAVRDRSHWNIQNIRPRDPVLLGICSQSDLDRVLSKYQDSKKPS